MNDTTDEKCIRPLLSLSACDIIVRQRTRLARVLSNEYYRLMKQEFETIRSALPTTMKNLLDIGAGIGGIHLFTSSLVNSNLNIHMLDYDAVDPVMRYGFRDSTESYNSVAESRRYLGEGGISQERLHYWNPGSANDMAKLATLSSTFDAIISLKSWCFHYPARTYASLVADLIAPGGVLIVDVRNSTGQEEEFKPYFSMVSSLSQDNKSRRVSFVATKTVSLADK